jgi:hypothetical protein
MQALIKLFSDLSPFVRMLFTLGVVLLLGSIGVEYSGVKVPDEMKVLFGVGGMLMIAMSVFSNDRTKERILRTREADVELRKAFIEAGQSDKADHTIISTNDKTNG